MTAKGVGAGFAVLAAIVAVVALFLHFAVAAFACGLDTSYCARSHEKGGYYTYRDLPDGPGGEPRGTVLRVSFDSRRDLPNVTFRRAPRAPLCIVWAQERTTPFAYGDRGTGPLNTYVPLNGAAPPGGCSTSSEGIPWDRADDLWSTWQFRSVWIVGVAGLLVLAASMLVDPRRRPTVRAYGTVLCALTPVLALGVRTLS